MNIMMQIRKKTKIEELNYLFLMECLASYKNPRDKLTALLKKMNLFVLKKDYTFFLKIIVYGHLVLKF